MTEELLKAIHVKTNAIDAVNTALQAEWGLLEELDKMVNSTDPQPSMQAIQEKVAELKALNAALPAAVVANVTPASAGPVGKSPAEQTLETGAATVEEGLTQAKAANEKVLAAAQALSSLTVELTRMVEGLNFASVGVKTGEAAKQL